MTPVTRRIHTFATGRRRTDGLATGEEGSVAMGAGCNPRVALRPPSSAPTCGPSGVLDSGGIERRVRERGGSPGASGGPPSPQGPGGRSHRRERGLLLLSSSIVPCLPDHPLQGPPAAVRPLYLPVRPQRGGGGRLPRGGRGGAAEPPTRTGFTHRSGKVRRLRWVLPYFGSTLEYADCM